MNDAIITEVELGSIGQSSGANPNPPTLTGGWKTSPLVKTGIDWLEITFPTSVSVPRPDFMDRDGQEAHPMNAYDRALKYADGRTEMTNSKRADMGTHVSMPGSVVARYQAKIYEILDIFLTGQGRFSRVDLSVDVFNVEGMTPREATRRIVAGLVKTRARKFPIANDAVLPGYTQYIGAPASEIRIRIYDKAAERGLDDLIWTRIEGQYRGDNAHAAARAVNRGRDEREVIRAYVDFPDWPEWEKVFRLPAMKRESEVRETNTERWLIEQCAPALAKQVALSGTVFLERFVSAYEDAGRRLAHSASCISAGEGDNSDLTT